MILKLFTTVFPYVVHHRPVTTLMFILFLFTAAANTLAADKSYLRLEQSKDSDLNDYKTTSIGALIFESNSQSHIDLLHLESDSMGNSLALDFGTGYVFPGDISIFLGVGLSLDYNFDTDDFNDKYYSEAGAVIDVARNISITARIQHFYHQPDELEEVVMLGLLFRH
ncbi:MAG: hypothetical protein OEY66_10170 [Gammaproteobacteria bacterium]|nr:hypothetical protein [Gammaproteobacteria bacterium]